MTHRSELDIDEMEDPQAEARLRRWVKAAVAVAVLLTVLLSFLSWRGAQQATETADWVAHTHKTMTLLESALKDSLDVETGGRAFAETGSVPFLAPYDSGRPALVQDLHRLRLLLTAPGQPQRLNVLEEQARNQVADVEEIVTARQNTGKIPPVALFEHGKHDMDALRITVEEMEVEERELLVLRTQRARAAQHSLTAVIALGSLLGVIFLCIAGMTLGREIGVSARAREQGKALNTGLERRVEQRTAALQSEAAVRKRTEETRERLAAIVESSDDAIISKTLDGTISAWNHGAEKLFGYAASEAVGELMVMLLPAERMGEEADILARMRRGERVEHFETVRVRKDGTRIDVSVAISPIRDGEGTIIGASNVARDITERKRAEGALQDSEESLRLALEGGRLGTWQWKLASDELEGSAVSLALFGVPANAEFTFARFRAALHPQDRVVVDEAMGRCLAGLAEYDAEYRTIQSDGGERWIAARGQAYKNAGNEITHVRGVVSEITDRRQAQVALRESEERFQVMANGIQQLAWMAEADGLIFWYNQRWYDYTGTGPGQAEGWTWEKIHDPAVLPEVLHRWREAIAGGTPFDMELPLRGADGSFRMFLTRVMPVRDAEGSVVRWLGTNTDISERKKAEEELARLAVELGQQAEDLARSQQDLEAQKLMLQSVLNSMVEGLVAADEQGKFILWNPAAEKIIGLGAADLAPEDWSAHYGTYLPDRVTLFPTERNPLQLAIRGEASSTEMYVCHPGLSQGAWIECNGAPLRNKEGVVEGGVVAFRDITRRRADELEIRKFNEELEERIAERTAQLETANHELEAFSYSVSHDLRAPLRHIGGYSRILMNDFGSGMAPEAKAHLQRIDDAVIRMGMLVDGLLSLAKLGRQSLKMRPTELNVIVTEAISVLQAECEGREVEWRIAQLPRLECDGVLVGQVFQNLLGNAVKYSRGRTKAVIEVDSIQQAGKPAVVFVRDNGAGFNTQYAEKLFGVFQRMHTEEEFEGTGVGLATVLRIIQKHGGRIWAEAETDHGATFYFTLGGNGKREQ
jgi:PAS domain S-box-containing protein